MTTENENSGDQAENEQFIKGMYGAYKVALYDVLNRNVEPETAIQDLIYIMEKDYKHILEVV